MVCMRCDCSCWLEMFLLDLVSSKFHLKHLEAMDVLLRIALGKTMLMIALWKATLMIAIGKTMLAKLQVLDKENKLQTCALILWGYGVARLENACKVFKLYWRDVEILRNLTFRANPWETSVAYAALDREASAISPLWNSNIGCDWNWIAKAECSFYILQNIPEIPF